MVSLPHQYVLGGLLHLLRANHGHVPVVRAYIDTVGMGTVQWSHTVHKASCLCTGYFCCIVYHILYLSFLL